jgi:HAD superfamily hydrolase (TIGR01662 family)
VTFLPNVIETLRARIEDFDAVFVITNQSGIEKGTLTPDDSNTIIAQVDQALHGKLTDFWSSPRTASAYRKPNPGMFLGLADKHYIDLAKSTMVGDSDIDRQAAKDAGIATFIWAKDFFKWEGHDGAQVETLTIRSVLHKGEIFRQGNVIVRDTGSWTPSVHDLLRHLEEVDFPAPRIVGSGLDENDRETLTYIPGDVGWDTVPSHDSAFALGEMIRRLHQATATFTPPPNAVWYPWCGRSLGESDRVIGHCDIAPWNIICHNGMPVALIDWDFAGPTDARIDLAQACWLCAKLHDDIVAENEGLPLLTERAQLLRAIVEGYGLSQKQRAGFIDLIIDFIIHFNAWQADDFGITHKNRPADPIIGWAFAWVSRSATWIHRHRSDLQNAIT